MNSRILILYATVTGNAEILANRTADRLRAEGFACEVKDIFDVQPQELAAERTLLLCISTYGEGDPPDPAAPMWEALVRDGSVRLPGLRFSVLALGDRSYTRFCQCGIDFDTALEKLGGQRIAPRVDCDVDYDAEWMKSLVPSLKSPTLAV
jgi:sulfite reductase (NADPH) flavoprotein alpha-component